MGQKWVCFFWILYTILSHSFNSWCSAVFTSESARQLSWHSYQKRNADTALVTELHALSQWGVQLRSPCLGNFIFCLKLDNLNSFSSCDCEAWFAKFSLSVFLSLCVHTDTHAPFPASCSIPHLCALEYMHLHTYTRCFIAIILHTKNVLLIVAVITCHIPKHFYSTHFVSTESTVHLCRIGMKLLGLNSHNKVLCVLKSNRKHQWS